MNTIQCPYCGHSKEFTKLDDKTFRIECNCTNCGKWFRIVRDFDKQINVDDGIDWLPKAEIINRKNVNDVAYNNIILEPEDGHIMP